MRATRRIATAVAGVFTMIAVTATPAAASGWELYARLMDAETCWSMGQDVVEYNSDAHSWRCDTLNDPNYPFDYALYIYFS
ncbi:hypothetical protein [Salinactinospora qingdaonensis]|uniref:Secreted protein n=1 Tax=Salinactinospora qingdaonensis TaxID=702744 RepID=A0ABP7G619_9ACTN